MSELSPEIAREQAHPKGLGTVGHEGWEEGVESEAWILKWAVWKGMGEGGMEGPLQSQGKPDIARPLEGKSVQREVRCWRVGGGEGWSSHLKKPFRVAACGSYFCFGTRKSHPFWGYHSPYKWLCFSGSSASKESTCNVGDPGSIPELGRSPGGGHGNPLQHSCLENPHGQRSLAGYSLWGYKELDTTEWLSLSQMIGWAPSWNPFLQKMFKPDIPHVPDIQTSPWVCLDFWMFPGQSRPAVLPPVFKMNDGSQERGGGSRSTPWLAHHVAFTSVPSCIPRLVEGSGETYTDALSKVGRGCCWPSFYVPLPWRAARSSLSLRADELGMVGGLSRTGPYGEGQHHWNYGWAAMTKTEIMPFAAIWRDLECVILKSVRQRKTNIIWYHLYVESKKMDTNELLFTK